MAEDTTHVVYQGKHYVLPGKLDPNDALVRVKNLSDTSGPKMQRGTAEARGFEDTTADAQAVLDRNPEPNRAQDVLPRLASFALMGTLPGGAGRGMAALRGLSAAEKARTVVTGGAKLAAAGGAGIVADHALQSAGVPPVVSEMIVAGAGLSTKPGRQLLKAGIEAVARREAAAAAPAVARTAAAAAEAAAPEAAAATAPARIPRRVAPVRSAPVAPAAPAAAPAAAPPTAGSLAVKPAAQPAVSATADEIAAKIVEWKTKQKFSGAQIQAAMKNLYGISPKDSKKMVAMVLEANGLAAPGKAAVAAADNALQPSRIQVGAQKVGRELGMTKEEVRKLAGPVLGEARGEASPILPKQALQKIIDTMKAMPVSEREAYVARATSGKTQWQVENIRRTLEHLGLLLPAGVAAGVAMRGRE